MEWYERIKFRSSRSFKRPMLCEHHHISDDLDLCQVEIFQLKNGAGRGCKKVVLANRAREMSERRGLSRSRGELSNFPHYVDCAESRHEGRLKGYTR